MFCVVASLIRVEASALPDSAVKESQHRVGTALKQFNYGIPGKSVTVNMAPADIRKEGSAYDLTIAMGILAANGDIPTEGLENFVIMGELALDGQIRSIRGALPIAVHARKDGFRGIILPRENAREHCNPYPEEGRGNLHTRATLP